MIKFFNSEKVYSSCVKKICNEYGLSFLNKIIAQKYVGYLLSILGPIDRRGTFSNLFEYTPIPKDYYTNLSFSEVSIESGQKIWNEADNKTVTLFWSGGIDSTTALVSLIQTNKNWKEQLRIVSSQYAIEKEYPLFFNKFLKDNVEILLLKNMEFFEPDLYNDKTYVVDGSCGDQIWGCNILQKLNDIKDKPFYNFFKTDIFNNFCRTNNKLVSLYIEELVEDFPVEIKTTAQMFWLLTFVYKWDHVRWRHMSCVRDPSVHHNMHNFFNTETFQKWAMSNTDKKLGETWNTYKQPAKDFIFEFTKDDDYRINKLQHESLGNSIESHIKSNNLYYYKLITDKHVFSNEDCFDKLI